MLRLFQGGKSESTRKKKLNGKAKEETQAPGEQSCKEKRQRHLNTHVEEKEMAKDAEKVSRELDLVSRGPVPNFHLG